MGNVEIGLNGEHEFIRRLNNLGIPYTYADEWVDFYIYNVPVDVKTCRISQKYSHKKGSVRYKIGCFKLTDEQLNKNCWYAFFIRHNEEFLFMGITNIKGRTKNKISIHELREIKTYSIQEFITNIKIKRI